MSSIIRIVFSLALVWTTNTIYSQIDTSTVTTRCGPIDKTCNDNDECTEDFFNVYSCKCEHTVVDSDNDGVCFADDPNDVDPCVPFVLDQDNNGWCDNFCKPISLSSPTICNDDSNVIASLDEEYYFNSKWYDYEGNLLQTGNSEFKIPYPGIFMLECNFKENNCMIKYQFAVPRTVYPNLNIVSSKEFLCSGETTEVWLNEGKLPSDYNIEWSNGNTDYKTMLTRPGLHSVKITNREGCVANDDIVIADGHNFTSILVKEKYSKFFFKFSPQGQNNVSQVESVMNDGVVFDSNPNEQFEIIIGGEATTLENYMSQKLNFHKSGWCDSSKTIYGYLGSDNCGNLQFSEEDFFDVPTRNQIYFNVYYEVSSDSTGLNVYSLAKF
jgi:hypothetical protein